MKRTLTLIFTIILTFSLFGCVSHPRDRAREIDYKFKATEPTTEPTEPYVFIFDSATLCECDICTILVTGIDAEDPDGYLLNVRFSNNIEAEETVKTEKVYETDDEGNQQVVGETEYIEVDTVNLVFELVSATVNGTETDIDFRTSAESDTRSFERIFLDAEFMENMGTIEQISLSFRIYNANNPDTTISTITGYIYPNGDPAAETE